MKILVVEDDHKIADAVARGLRQHNFAVDVAYDGDAGLSGATSESYDLLILDRMLPGSIDGIGILQKIRGNNDQTPALLLTAKDKVLDRAHGLNQGADDYLVKPFAFVELIARVRALLRRPKNSLPTSLSHADLKLHASTRKAKRGNKTINLSAKEYALLDYFMRNINRVITKEELIQHVWDYSANILPNTVEVHIGYLRNKIDKPFNKPLLHTKRGFGYIFGENS